MIPSINLLSLTAFRKQVPVEYHRDTKLSSTETSLNANTSKLADTTTTFIALSSSAMNLPRSANTDSIDTSGIRAETNKSEKNHSISSNEHVSKKESKTRRISSLLGYTLRLLLLDLPLLIVLLTYAGLLWMKHVHIQYLKPQLDSLVFHERRFQQEITYYKRICTVDDMTTFDGSDLFLTPDATPEQAYQHQLKHGFSVFRNVLSGKTASNLRQYIDGRNRQLLDQEKIFVIEGDHRYSFALGTEEPTVSAAMKEIATSPTLVPALEKILGNDPALIEMTAITSSYQAKAQYWHDDVVADGSAMNFVRTFGPSYSVFVQLQNTTREMGATTACPGTHYCSDGDLVQICEEHGIPLLNAEYQHWGAGDALLMNMNSYHRGAAHTDPNALDRIMLILTFVPKPIDRAESRQMSQGITFSLRWDMWGHTLYDLAHADTGMKQPWATLRALGLYKKDPKASWGIDYISGGSMRLANYDNGFRKSDLQKWIQWGGFKYLPSSLEAKVDFAKGEHWYEYYTRTHELCTNFMKKVSSYSIGGYLSFFAIISVIPVLCRQGSFPSPRRHCLPPFILALIRISCMISFAFYALNRCKKHVDETGWANDIKGGRRYASTVKYDELAFIDERIDDANSPSTFPTRYDVLVETRYGSEQFEMYNDFINNHPGNRLFQELLQRHSSTFGNHTLFFQEATAAFILETIGLEYGRFLIQNPTGLWLWMTYEDTMEYILRQLAINTNPVVKHSTKVIRSLRSNLIYGVHRDTVLSRKHGQKLLRAIEKKIYGAIIKAAPKRIVEELPEQSNIFHELRMFHLPEFSSDSRRIEREFTISWDYDLEEPTNGAWLAAGDVVETSIGDGYWYYGTIQTVSAHGSYTIKYSEGVEELVDIYDLRRAKPYHLGEQLQVMVPAENSYYECVVKAHDDAQETFNVYVRYLGMTLRNVKPEDLRRPGGPLTHRPDLSGGYH